MSHWLFFCENVKFLKAENFCRTRQGKVLIQLYFNGKHTSDLITLINNHVLKVRWFSLWHYQNEQCTYKCFRLSEYIILGFMFKDKRIMTLFKIKSNHKPYTAKSITQMGQSDYMTSTCHLKVSRWLNHFSGQPMLNNAFHGQIFPNIQPKLLLAQREAISSCPVADYLGAAADPCLATISCQLAVRSDTPQTPFLQSKHSQLPQPST